MVFKKIFLFLFILKLKSEHEKITEHSLQRIEKQRLELDQRIELLKKEINKIEELIKNKPVGEKPAFEAKKILSDIEEINTWRINLSEEFDEFDKDQKKIITRLNKLELDKLENDESKQSKPAVLDDINPWKTRTDKRIDDIESKQALISEQVVTEQVKTRYIF